MPLVLVRAVYGTILLVAPHTAGVAGDGPPGRGAVLFARVLGARHLAEAAALATHRSEGWRVAGACVDGVHAASAVALALLVPARRRLLLGNAALAAAFAAAGLRAAASSSPSSL